jgi:CheY-like chemotaxis protein
VFFNLLSNAVKCTPAGGTITFRLREHLSESNKIVMVGEVADTGIGMSDEFQKIMFEPFTQERRMDKSYSQGTGLGLAIVKRIIDFMDCTITVKSKLGKGSIFTVTGEFDCVPADTSQKLNAAGEMAKGQDDSILKDKHVLLCEDNILNQEIAATLLEAKQMIVEVAADGRVGVTKFLQSPVNFYDIILMDIRMPDMDGYEAARTIRRLQRPDAQTIPIIAVTADAFSDDVDKSIEAGMNGYIAKPVDPLKLYETIGQVLKKNAQ